MLLHSLQVGAVTRVDLGAALVDSLAAAAPATVETPRKAFDCLTKTAAL